jgi:aspartyl protease family protein
MLRLAVIAVIGALSATVAAKGVLMLDRANHGAVLRPAQSASPDEADGAASSDLSPQAAVAAGQAAEVSKSPDGHYWAEANVNGHDVHFLVDTGATAVALTVADAQLNYAYQVATANGPTLAAKVKLDSVAVAGAEVRNVDAFVIQSGLQNSLLGMTYLGRLSQFDATPTALILRP